MAGGPPDTSKLLWTTVAPRGGPGQDEAAVRREFSIFEFSQEAAFQASIIDILNRDLGYDPSLRAGQSLLGDGRPVPLISYGLIEYLLALDHEDADVLELGGGQSTLFWARKARSVLTLEHDLGWVGRLSAEELRNVRLVEVKQDGYVPALMAQEGEFDVVVIDCAANRYDCAAAAVARLRAGGMIILDNSDWYPNTAAALRDADLIQVDFPDFRPLHHYRGTTSIFLHRDFRAKPAGRQLPPPALGGKDRAAGNIWDIPGPR